MPGSTMIGFKTTSGGEPLLEVEALSVALGRGAGAIPIVADLSFQVRPGEVVAVIGESGAGKSMSALAIMDILPPTAGVTGGSIRFMGEDLLTMPAQRRRMLRGSRMAMVHQDAPTALNPVYSIGWQIAEMFRVHRGATAADARREAIALMKKVGLPNAEERAGAYPHQFSGGMRQRAMIAMAIALEPAFLIADEPTTALDVTVQRQILDLLVGLQQERGMGLLLITHDFGVVAEVADRVIVLYAGRVVETGTPDEILTNPAHPYARALAACVPHLDSSVETLPSIPGMSASLATAGPGCAFAPRCPLRRPICLETRPALREIAPGRRAACHFSEEVLADDSRAVA
ncbi:ABC transporter ATP-binding protein [Bosea sp. 2KB_26]|uniref:ABC transporter ATP-binding protein n=1 Tax=Bosea sp. 2KB_26 TaxID=3237475 RepID=UPI003F9210FB